MDRAFSDMTIVMPLYPKLSRRQKYCTFNYSRSDVRKTDFWRTFTRYLERVWEVILTNIHLACNVHKSSDVSSEHFARQVSTNYPANEHLVSIFYSHSLRFCIPRLCTYRIYHSVEISWASENADVGWKRPDPFTVETLEDGVTNGFPAAINDRFISIKD